MFKIHYDISSLENINNIVTGIVYVECNNVVFPEVDWNDFIVVICDWWLSNNRLLRNEIVDLTYRFMDGPCLFRIAGIGDYPEHSCYWNDEVKYSTIVYKQDVIHEIEELRECLLNECRERGWNNDAINRLAMYKKDN